jgi:hypothetical protein
LARVITLPVKKIGKQAIATAMSRSPLIAATTLVATSGNDVPSGVLPKN